jgi:hypothetical protein
MKTLLAIAATLSLVGPVWSQNCQNCASRLQTVVAANPPARVLQQQQQGPLTLQQQQQIVPAPVMPLPVVPAVIQQVIPQVEVQRRTIIQERQIRIPQPAKIVQVPQPDLIQRIPQPPKAVSIPQPDLIQTVREEVEAPVEVVQSQLSAQLLLLQAPVVQLVAVPTRVRFPHFLPRLRADAPPVMRQSSSPRRSKQVIRGGGAAQQQQQIQ